MKLALWILLPAAAFAQVTPAAIANSPNSDWLTYNGDYAATRHSSLKQITPANAGTLVPKWVFRIKGAKQLEASPIVHDGLMYISNTNEMYALDARSGRRVWHYHAAGAKGTRVNRGLAILGDRVFFATADCHLIALNRRTGNLVFDVEYASFAGGYTTSIAPLALKDSILVGVAGGGSGQRGFVAAIHPLTGKENWRFWTVPAKGEPGSDTWGNFPAEMGGAPPGLPDRTTLPSTFSIGPPAIPGLISMAAAAPATISIPIASWPSTPLPAS